MAGSVNTQLKIFLAMLNADRPMRMVDISDETGISIQLVYHHIPNMVKDGIVLPVDIEGEKHYMVQEVFLNDDVFKMLSEFMLPVIKYIGNNLSYEYTDLEHQDVIRNNLMLYIIATSRKLNEVLA